MHILFVHQNFPAQFKHLAPALVQQGHHVSALIMKNSQEKTWQGVELITYQAKRSTTNGVHPWVGDFETKIIRAEAALRAAENLVQQGFNPDIIIAHPGWGESLFLKQVWSKAKLGIYCEFFYHATGFDTDFDPEFPVQDVQANTARLRIKNTHNILQFNEADLGLSPTHFQASTFPQPFQQRIRVIHDGIDTQAVRPNPNVTLTLNGKLRLTRKQEVITFVNRNLEPYRGYHIFMRALPELLARRPNATILIVGGDSVSYGQKAPQGQTWKNTFIQEVRAQIPDPDWSRVYFLGNISYPHFINLLQLSTVHVYLTYPFVLSWSLLEAMSAGCAIVASDTAPLKEVITDHETGRFVDFFSPQALSQTICELCDDPKSRKRLGHNARSFAQANYDLKSVCLPQQLKWVNELYHTK